MRMKSCTFYSKFTVFSPTNYLVIIKLSQSLLISSEMMCLTDTIHTYFCMYITL